MFDGNSRSPALFALAISAIALITWAIVAEPNCDDVLPLLKNYEASAQEESYEGRVTCERDCQVSFAVPVAAQKKRGECSKQENTDCDTPEELDLIEQKKMAHWAKISAILALFALFGVLFTFRETREIGKAQTRAYVSITGGSVTVSESNLDEVLFAVDIHNSGNSPAHDITIIGRAVIEYIDDGHLVFSHEYYVPTLRVNQVGGDETQVKTATRRDLVPSGAVDLLNGRAEFGFYGTVKYEDIFGEKFSIDFALAGKAKRDDKPGIATGRLEPIHTDRWNERQ